MTATAELHPLLDRRIKNESPRSKRSKHPSLPVFLEINLSASELLVVEAVVAALAVAVGTSVSIVVSEFAVTPALVKEVDRGGGDTDDIGDTDDTDDSNDADGVPGITASHSRIRLSTLFELPTKQP
jgi:hypothetical protein